MKKQILAYLAKSAGCLALFAAVVGAGTASCAGIYQPKVPQVLQK